MCPKLFGKRFHSGTGTTATSRAHLGEDLEHAAAALRGVLGVQAEVEQRELELAHHLQAPHGSCACAMRRACLSAGSGAPVSKCREMRCSTSGCQA